LMSQRFCDLESLPPHNPLVLSQADTVRKAIMELSKRHLRGCVVADNGSCSRESMKVFDLRHVVRLLVSEHRRLGDSQSVETILEGVLETPIGQSINAWPTYKFATADSTETLAEVTSHFLTSDRIFIFNKSKLVSVFGVSDFVALVRSSKCFDCLNDESRLHSVLTETPAKDFATSEKLVCATDKDSLLHVLELFDSTGYSGIPIVDYDDQKTCLGVLSVRDLVPLYLWNVAFDFPPTVLSDPAIGYLTAIRSHSPKGVFPYIHVSENASMLAVVNKIMAANIHRVLLTEGGKLTGLLSTADISKVLAKEMASL